MNKKDSIVITTLIRTQKKLMDELMDKHDEHGEFLPEIKNPHLHKKKHHVCQTYHLLIVEIESICRSYDLCKKTTRTRFKSWLQKLKQARSLEHTLYHEFDIGGDH